MTTIYVYGGAVRDRLLGRPANDIDIVVDGTSPDAALRQLGASRITQLHTTPPVWLGILPDRKVVNATLMTAAPIERYLRERCDFTVNAMAVPWPAWQQGNIEANLIDPDGLGRYHLERRVLALAHPAALHRDPLRILRAYRQAAELGLAFAETTWRAIRQALWMPPAAPLARVSPERIGAELFKWFGALDNESAWTLRDAAHVGAFDVLIDVFGALHGIGQGGYHHADVWTHTLETALAALSILADPPEIFDEKRALEAIKHYALDPRCRAVVVAAALLHDIGKAETMRFLGADDPKRWQFYEHDSRGAQRAAQLMERWAWPRDVREAVATVIAEHMRIITMGPEPTLRARVRWLRTAGHHAPALAVVAMADALATRGPLLASWQRSWTLRLVYKALDAVMRQGARLPTLVNGHDVMRALGIEPGPQVGRILRRVREAQEAGEISTRDEALDFVVKNYGQGGQSNG